MRAVKGAASTAMLRWAPPPRSFDTAILSIGSNDDIGSFKAVPGNLRGAEEARRRRVRVNISFLRQHLPVRRVIWLLPYDRRRAAIVESIAASFGDEILDVARFASRDGIHPASYRQVAAALLR